MEYTRDELLKSVKILKMNCNEQINCDNCPFWHVSQNEKACLLDDIPSMWKEEMIKPQKKLVPFDFSLKEDRDAVRGKWITDGSIEILIIGFAKHGDEWYAESITTKYILHAKTLFKYFVFADTGKPVGKEVEE